VERLAAADTCAQVNSPLNVVAIQSKDADETQTPQSSGEEASLLMNGHAIGLTGDTTIADWLQLIRAEYAEVRVCRRAYTTPRIATMVQPSP
jgi:hypothetical protein